MNPENIYIQQIEKININNPDLGIDFDIDILANESGGAQITLEPKQYQFGDGQERQLYINAKLQIHIAQSDHTQTIADIKPVINKLNTKIAIIVKQLSETEDERWYFDQAIISGYSIKRGFGDEPHILSIQVSNAVLKEEDFCIYGYNDYDIKQNFDTIPVGSSKSVCNVWQRSMNYFHNNKIWFVAQVNKNNIQTNYMWYYDLLTETYSQLKDLNAPGTNGNDNHHWLPVLLTDDGYILFVYDYVTSSHNHGIIIKRSQNPEDYSNFNTVYDGHAQGYFQAYPNLYKFPNRKIMALWRGEPQAGSNYNNCGMFSYDGGQTWEGEFKIVEEINGISGITDPINYYIISGQNRNGQIGMQVIVRNGSGGKFKWIFYYQSDDGETWYNAERTFSKNVISDGAITSQESLDYFLIDDSIPTTTNDYSTQIAINIDDDGTPFLFYGLLFYVNGTYERHAYMVHFKDGIKHKIEITNLYTDFNTILSYSLGTIVRKNGIVDIFVSPIDQKGEYYYLNQYRSFNYGQIFYLYRHKIIKESDQWILSYRNIAMNFLQNGTKEGFLQIAGRKNDLYDLLLLHLKRKE